MRAGAAERPNGHHRGVSTSPFVIYFAYGVRKSRLAREA